MLHQNFQQPKQPSHFWDRQDTAAAVVESLERSGLLQLGGAASTGVDTKGLTQKLVCRNAERLSWN